VRFQGLEFRVEVLGFRAKGLGFRVQGSRLGVYWCMVSNLSEDTSPEWARLGKRRPGLNEHFIQTDFI